MKKIIKPKSLLPLPIAIISFEIYLGMVIGYFLGKFFSGKETGQPGRAKSFVFRIGNWKIHLHHWLICFGILIFSVFHSFLPITQFSFGLLGGLIFQGIYCYSDWYKILSKKEKNVIN